MELLIGLGIIYIIFAVSSEIKARKKLADHIDSLKKEGFSEDYKMDGRPYIVIIDQSKGILAFVSSKNIKKVNFNEVISWQHTYTEQNKTVNGVYKHLLINNKLEFTIRDPDMPLIQIAVPNHQFAKQWSARFTAILN